MIRKNIFFLLSAILLSLLAFSFQQGAWGFFGHRLINRMAIFTLPEAMLPLFKSEIEYITEHAVDPDKRRYATLHEGVRHYIDIDHWGEYPFDEVPRDFDDALIKYTDILLVQQVDTTWLKPDWDVGDALVSFEVQGSLISDKRISTSYANYAGFYAVEVSSQYYAQEKIGHRRSIEHLFDIQLDSTVEVFYRDRFSEYGILPYHLLDMYYGLVYDFKKGDKKRILQRATDLGHYIGDAHVPLHTTENYNGQFTDQVGIHAFWESRLPELFAISEYDFFVGQAQYVEDKSSYFWGIILDSHALLDSVLQIELRTRRSMPQDMITCFEDRLERNVQVPCRSFSRAYHTAMNGMVEQRLRASILSLGDVWYSAWVDAGKPDLGKIVEQEVLWTAEELREQKRLEELRRSAAIKGRSHSD